MLTMIGSFIWIIIRMAIFGFFANLFYENWGMPGLATFVCFNKMSFYEAYVKAEAEALKTVGRSK